MRSLLLLLLCSACIAHAEVGDLWAALPAVSFHEHQPSNGRYNERHLVLGAEYEFKQNWRLAGGYYQNSRYRDSLIAGVNWFPLQHEQLHFGVTGGLLTGYTKRPLPFALPIVAAEGRTFGANFVWVPTKVFIIEFKLRMR